MGPLERLCALVLLRLAPPAQAARLLSGAPLRVSVCVRAAGSPLDDALRDEVELGASLGEMRTQASVLRRHLGEALEKEERKRKALSKEADTAVKSEQLAATAELIISNLYALKDEPAGSDGGGRELRLSDWAQLDEEGMPTEVVVTLPAGAGSAREWAEATFKKARRMRRGSAAIAELLARSEKASAQLAALRGRVDEHELAEQEPELQLEEWAELERLARRAGVELPSAEAAADGQERPAKPKVGGSGRAPTLGRGNSLREWEGRRFLSPDGVQILVGRNKRENEALALTIAKHPDIWLHVRGCPGAHVVLRLSKGARKPAPDEEPPEATMQMAANLAAFYSDMRNERRADVSVASPKQLYKPRGAPLGAIGVRQEMPNRVGFPADVPEECKEARSQSGLEQFDDNLVGDGKAAGKSGRRR